MASWPLGGKTPWRRHAIVLARLHISAAIDIIVDILATYLCANGQCYDYYGSPDRLCLNGG